MGHVDVHEDDVVLAAAVEALQNLQTVLDDVRLGAGRADLLQDLRGKGEEGEGYQ